MIAVLEVGVGRIFVLSSACRRGGFVSIAPREREKHLLPLSSHHRQSTVSSGAYDTPILMTSVRLNVQMFSKEKVMTKIFLI